MGKLNHGVASGIFELLANEADSRMNYSIFLSTHSHELTTDDVKTIQKIARCKASCMLILQAMARNYDGNLSAADVDGVLDALEALENIAKDVTRC